MPGLDQVVAAMNMKDRQVDLIAHNVSNANTSGFKEQRISFEETLDSVSSTSSRAPSTSTEATVYTDYTSGEIVDTSNPLDLAIEGGGFFQVQGTDGEVYTRNGAFAMDNQGYLVTMDGHKILGKNGPIQLDGKGDISISRQGQVFQGTEDKGVLKIVDFEDKTKLTPAGSSLYKPESDAVSQEVSNPSVLQGSLEMSNVSVISNMAQLIDAMRQYQAYQKVISNQIRLDQEMVGTIGRLA